MKNIKKSGKRLLAMVLSLVMCFGLLQTSAFAASGTRITINVRVYDQSTGAVYNVGTDSVAKGDPELIQSVAYQIPQLTKFVDANRFGRVTKVVGNWYFPAGDSQPGANVEWSCNANSVTMTYWVNWYSTGSGSGSGSDQETTVNIGSGGRYSWTQYITYHSNYPDGNSYSYKVTYNIQSYTATYNDWSCIKSLSDVKFSTPNGYEAKSPIWNTNQAGTGTGYAPGSQFTFQQADNGKTLHLYAQWQPTGGTPVETVTLTYMDGDSAYRTINGYFKGDQVVAIDCTNEKEGYTFEGWDTSSSASEVKYAPGTEFTLTGNTTLYAVWAPVQVIPATTTLTVSKVLNGIDASQLPDNFTVSATVINGSSYQAVTLNKNKLEETVTISTSSATTVVISESNYAVDHYDCEVTDSTGNAVTGNAVYMLDAGTLNPTCSIINTYTFMPGVLVGNTTYTKRTDEIADFTTEMTNEVGATLSAARITVSFQDMTMIMGTNGQPDYTIKLVSKDGVESVPNVSDVTSDGKQTVWLVDGPIEPDAKIVLKYSGKVDEGVVSDEKWTYSVAGAYMLAQSAAVYSNLDSLDCWIEAYCERGAE